MMILIQLVNIGIWIAIIYFGIKVVKKLFVALEAILEIKVILKQIRDKLE